MKEGKVKFLKEDKGYGFIIETKTNKEYFFHVSGIVGGATLSKDDDVSFDVVNGKKGLNAVNIRAI